MFGGDALVVEADGDDGLFADVSCVHPGDDFLSEVAAFGEVNTGVHESGFGGEVGWSEIDVVEGVSGFDSGGVDGEPSGGFELFVFEEGFVGGFELIGGDGEGESDLSGEIKAVGDEFGVVVGSCGVVVFVDGVSIEEFEDEGAVDGDPVEGVVDGDFDVLCEDECVERIGGWFGEVLIETNIRRGIGFDDSEVGVDTALAVEPKGVEGLTGFEVVYFCGEHVVEEGVAF